MLKRKGEFSVFLSSPLFARLSLFTLLFFFFMLFRYFKPEAKKPKHTEPPVIKASHLCESVIGPYRELYGRHPPSVVSYLCQKEMTAGCSLWTAEEEYGKAHALDIKFDCEGVLAACVTADSSFRIVNFADSATRSSTQEVLRQKTLCPCKAVFWRPAAGEQTDIVCCPTGAQHPIALYNLETCANDVPTLVIKRKEAWGFAEDALFLSHDLLCAGFRSGGRVCLWDMRTRSHQREFQALLPRDELRSLSVPCGNNDGHEILAASTSGVLRLWDLRQTSRPLLDVNCISGIPGAKYCSRLNALGVSPGVPGVVAFTATDCVQRLVVGLFDMQRNRVVSWLHNAYFPDRESLFGAGLGSSGSKGSKGRKDRKDDGLIPVVGGDRAQRESKMGMIRDVLYGRGAVHFMPQQGDGRAPLVCFSNPDGVTVAKLPDREAGAGSVVNTFRSELCCSVAVHPFINTQMLCSSMWNGVSVIF